MKNEERRVKNSIVMEKIKYMMLSLMMAMVVALPMQAQDVNDDEVVESQDETELADSTLIDSLATDTQKLPWPVSVQVGLDKLLESKMFETSQVGLMVWDLEADSCIYKRNERQLMRPASTMKLLTAITAFDKLGGSYQFKTSLKYTGTIENGVLTGDVYCIGGMDPRFNSDDMAAFANGLKEMGIDTIRGSIYADRSMKDADLLGEGWCWDDDNPVLSPLVFARKDIFMDRFLAKLKDVGTLQIVEWMLRTHRLQAYAGLATVQGSHEAPAFVLQVERLALGFEVGIELRKLFPEVVERALEEAVWHEEVLLHILLLHPVTSLA